MKIDVDLTEVFESEDGGSLKLTLADRLIDSITEKVLSEYKKTLDEKIEKRLSKKIDDTLDPVLTEKLKELFNNLLDYEFVPADKWGNRDKPTTLRARVIKALEENSQFKKSSYGSDQNVFTNEVSKVVQEQIKEFKDEMKKQMTNELRKEAIETAAKFLKEKM